MDAAATPDAAAAAAGGYMKLDAAVLSALNVMPSSADAGTSFSLLRASRFHPGAAAIS